jgi:outer membrane protein assembly factor BamD (BamD/ComL family)/cbb3-type cytochrome oxidase subunit 3
MLPKTMSHALHIIWNVFLSLFGLGFIGWLFWRSLKQSDDPAKLIFKWVLTVGILLAAWKYVLPMYGGGGLDAIFAIGMMGGLAITFNIIWRHSLIEMFTKPLTNLFDGGSEPPEPKPYYSMAIAKRKTNHPLEAIVTIREQLAKFPTDFEGILLLANIQAEDMNDLPSAEITLNNFCNSPGAPDRQVVAALTQLADWHLKKGADVDAARAALQKIVARFPDTEIALRAEQRLAHLGETEKIILAQHDRQALAVPVGVDNIGLLNSTEFLRPKEIEPGKLAAVHMKHLEQHPHDTEVREKLATIYARDFKRLDLATLELEQLINEPKHKPKQVAAWLNLLVNFQVELGADVATVTATLGKIVAQFPDSPMAEIAQRRLARVNQELQGKKETPSVKLGVYEQDIGLKYGLPRQL